MIPKTGQYFYAQRGRRFRIYRYDIVTLTSSSASAVNDEPQFSDSEEARKRVYQLNGWKYTPRQK